ncbi:preprotein translocase subunit SecY [Gordonia sp. (in: high G+C Gram-positive bacteria)]|uniref:preprotein translocase subunit SecY n=1 Tax=Gordonia sp. (in: high G+C Gram-positive bacteria) TaxID=84139 RepID=UPI0016A6A2C9|nr:preprotein translocase subunit SecY [Gordonia sp. (in: high G+C Gram-positive bacteria)]NLG45718.1 preprotein translocase subunit SecY [Gordonia sp. (in: high G+C Gram-positive bacteria)]
MLSPLVATFRSPDLRKKIFYALGILVLYRIGATLPSPGVDFREINRCVDAASQGDSGQIYSLINMFSGGALLQLSVFAIGIMPYITASIIVQLLTVVIPRFEQLRKEGQSGQTKMTQYTRYLTVALALLQSTGIVALAATGNLLPASGEDCNPDQILQDTSILGLSIIVLVMTAGACLVMWFGELITERGVGNGMSLLIFVGIVARLPAEGRTILQQRGGLTFGLICVAIVLILVAVVFVEQGMRRIPVQYAKRMVGRKMYGGSSTYMPIKVNTAGVIPVIFASSLLYIPQLILQLTGGQNTDGETAGWKLWLEANLINPSSWFHITFYFLLIIFFTYFYVAVTFNPEERADDMKRYGGFIPGIRPGKPTADYLSYVLSRITLPGSLYLGIISILPNLFMDLSGGTGQNIPFGGTALLIIVVVGLDTIKQVNSQLMQRKYEGFLK